MPHTLLTVSHHIARVTLHYPPANVLTHAVLKELEQVFAELEADEYVRVVVLTGSDRFFSAGADVHELKHLHSKYSGSEFSLRGQACLNRIERCEKPVIAAINGICLGGGLELAMACHMQIAAAGSSLGLPEIAFGVIPGFGGTQRMTRLVGLSKAAELILTGERVTAEEALRIGLVGRVVPAAGLLKEAEALAAAIATRGRVATRAALRAIRGGCDRPVSEGLVRESELFGELCETQDKNEGIQAFLEKRPPHFADTDP